MDSFEDRLDSAGALADDLRRDLYLFIRQQRRPVGRDEAAQAAGISRKLAAFHLDKLVEKGLLGASYARLTGRSGPGAGRPAKVYQPSGSEVSVAIPYRAYDVVGDILLDALETDGRKGSTEQAARDAAFERGLELGKTVATPCRPRATSEDAQTKIAAAVLSDRGYEPYDDQLGNLRLHNCPFHRLARRSPEFVCGLNQAFVQGVLCGLEAGSLVAKLDPLPGECCVQVERKEHS